MGAARIAHECRSFSVFAIPKLKVLYTVVGLVTIDVMDSFGGKKPPSKVLLHHESVL
jgi:hypothetical protein